MLEVECPNCGGIEVSKHGKTPKGIQRYYCKNKKCPAKTFQLEHSYNICKVGIEENIIDMAANTSDISDTARVLKISTYKAIKL